MYKNIQKEKDNILSLKINYRYFTHSSMKSMAKPCELYLPILETIESRHNSFDQKIIAIIILYRSTLCFESSEKAIFDNLVK